MTETPAIVALGESDNVVVAIRALAAGEQVDAPRRAGADPRGRRPVRSQARAPRDRGRGRRRQVRRGDRPGHGGNPRRRPRPRPQRRQRPAAGCAADLRRSGTVIRGYRRADGRLGARNHVLVLPSVVCSGLTAQLIAGDDAMLGHAPARLRRGRRRRDAHGGRVLRHGDQSQRRRGARRRPGLRDDPGHRLAERIGEEGQRVRYAGIQADGGTAKTVARGRELLSGLQSEIGDARREPAPEDQLVIGLDDAAAPFAGALRGLTSRAGARLIVPEDGRGRRAAPGARDGRRTGHRRVVRPRRGPARLRHLPRDLRVWGRGAVTPHSARTSTSTGAAIPTPWRPDRLAGRARGCSTAAPRRQSARGARDFYPAPAREDDVSAALTGYPAPRRPLGRPQPRARHARPRRREPRRRADRAGRAGAVAVGHQSAGGEGDDSERVRRSFAALRDQPERRRGARRRRHRGRRAGSRTRPPRSGSGSSSSRSWAAAASRATIEAGTARAARAVERAARLERAPMAPAELVLGLECGGSDALSGITANPALGVASDLPGGRRRDVGPGRDAGADRRRGHPRPARRLPGGRRGACTT